MNNNEETNSNKDQEQKIDTPENIGVEPNLEILNIVTIYVKKIIKYCFKYIVL